ncbi:hypothetical protein [uncultured Roseovarius sp.]|uniref:hypothetical protein n=1 Tax=uncultured Roseovarius sp. TaxID=293344 RepID=UPI0026146F62|nr:hypothetical protein [uncultured Roseovarius sp.]
MALAADHGQSYGWIIAAPGQLLTEGEAERRDKRGLRGNHPATVMTAKAEAHAVEQR